MRIALLADAFPPMATSASVQLRDLALELNAQGHQVLAIIASPTIDQPHVVEDVDGVEVLRLQTRPTKDVGLIRRGLAEALMSFDMLRNLKTSPYADVTWDGIVWYSPTIFLGPVVRALKRRSACRAYLILRDIFPDWAVDVGVLKPGLVYRLFKFAEHFQYETADIIGVQSGGNLPYLQAKAPNLSASLEVLNNWLAPAPSLPCSINLAETRLKGRLILVYAGNIGIAQGLDIFFDLAAALRVREDIGFVFVGRGSELARLKGRAIDEHLDNVLFYDEIPAKEVKALYEQCEIGLVSLDPRHETHNIPGKFLSYMEAGLPVLASVNSDNDLVALIQDNQVGKVLTTPDVLGLRLGLEELVAEIATASDLPERCRTLADRLFSAPAAALQIITGLEIAA
jgi:glycosyltransferase involved in cell wall biosynthesis